MYTTLISPADLTRHLDNPAWVVVDCRFRLEDPTTGRNLYEESHIPGAVYAHLDDDLAGPGGGDAGRHPLPDMKVFQATLGAWGIGAGVQVVVYDDWGGAAAARLWWMLRYLGHEAVAVLDGGWPAWVKTGYPTAQGEESASPVEFVGEPNPAMVATLTEVEQMVAAGAGGRLIDARDARRYSGELTTLDPVAGHIPGAQNRPFTQNLERRGQFRAAEQLQADYAPLLGERDPEEIILYCGSGVTACHNLLAMTVAGLPGARLFVGSWSGWSSDPKRPIENS